MVGSSHPSSRRRRRGFTLVEVLVSMGVLGIGLLGLVSLYTSSTRGAARSRLVTTAAEIARQESAVLLAQGADPTLLTACPASTVLGCRASSTTYAPTKTCTAYLRDADVPDPSGGLSRDLSRTSFRRDVEVASHPDTINHPEALLVTVSVCWQDEGGRVQELETQHLLVPGV